MADFKALDLFKDHWGEPVVLMPPPLLIPPEPIDVLNQTARQLRIPAGLTLSEHPDDCTQVRETMAWADMIEAGEWIINVRLSVTSEGQDVLRSPPLWDLTGDTTACYLIRLWARQPWVEAHRLILADYLEEKGEKSIIAICCLRNPRWTHASWRLYQAGDLGRRGRRLKQRVLADWRKALVNWFGEFDPPQGDEANPLLRDAVDTPSGG